MANLRFLNLLVATLLVPATLHAGPILQVHDVSNDPIDLADLKKPIHEFFGDYEGPAELGLEGLFRKHFLPVLQLGKHLGPNPWVQQLKNGSRLISGCKAHDCLTKGAIVIKNNKIQSAAITYVVNIRDEKGKIQDSALAIYIFMKSLDFNPEKVEPIMNWIIDIQKDNKNFRNTRITFVRLL